MKWLFSFVLLLSVESTFAQDTVVAPSKELSAEKPESEKTKDREENPEFMALAQVVGYGPVSGGSKGVSFGIFVTPRSVLSIDYTDIQYSELFFNFHDYEVSGQSVGLGYKHFISNTFYYKGSANYRYTSYKKREDFLYTGDTETRFKANTYEVGFAIGNQWQIGNFTLGCDWFGISQPISSKVFGKYVSDNADNWDIDDYEDDQDKYTKRMNFKAVHFYLGATF